MRPCPGGGRTKSTRKRATLPYLRLLGAQLAIGAAAIFARYALRGAGPLAVSALRLGIAALIAIVIARGFARTSRRRERAFAFAGLALAIHFATWFASLQYTSVAVSTVLVTTTPIWTEIYDVVRERRPPSGTYLIALVLALCGVVAIVTSRASTPAPIRGHAIFGDALAICGSIAIGAYLIMVRAAGATSDGGRIATPQIVARTYSWSALVLVLPAALARQAPPAFGDMRAWAGVLAMALISQLLGHTALNAALRNFSPSTIALTTLLEPVFAALLAAWLFRETVAPLAIGGSVVVLAAVALVLLRSSAAGDALRPAREN